MNNRIVDADKYLKKVMYSKILRIAFRNSIRAYKRLKKNDI